LLVGAVILLGSAVLGGCSVKNMAVNALADQLSSGTGGALTTDEDLELVGDAVPFALKLMEILVAQAPDHVGLHQALASGFVQYGMVWVQFPAEQLKYEHFTAYQTGLERARKLYLRANGYAMGGLDLLHPGFSQQFMADPDAALASTTTDDVALLYWAGASWLAAISLSRESPELIGQLPLAAKLLYRCEELDEDWDRGAIHELLISLEPSMPIPGGNERALAHYERAVQLSGGLKASPHVAVASLYIKSQDRAQFVEHLNRALAVDPDASEADRLANVYAQRKVRYLLDHLDDLFVDEEF
jgi:predicted anti-sigma-YlaC factor YlaD